MIRVALVDPDDAGRAALRDLLLGLESVWLEAECGSYAIFPDVVEQARYISAQRDEIRSVRLSRRARVIAVTDRPIQSDTFMISTTGDSFRAGKGPIDTSNAEGVRLQDSTAASLRVSVDDQVRFVELAVFAEDAGLERMLATSDVGHGNAERRALAREKAQKAVDH